MASANEIKFIEVNVVNALTAGNIVSKIEEMRQKLAVTRTRNRPVLTPALDDKDPQLAKKLTWFDIVLVLDGGRGRIRVRLRTDKLYLQGFRLNDAGDWFELGKDGKDKDGKPLYQHLIDKDSKFLGYGHTYGDLLRAAGLDFTGGLTQISIGRDKLISAANWLLSPPDVKKRAEALLILIPMFCEAARFVPILNYMRRTFQQSLKLPAWVESLVHKWGDLSGCVLFYDANPNYKWVPQTLVVEGPAPNYEPVKKEARSVDELLEYLGILQRDPATIHPPKP